MVELVDVELKTWVECLCTHDHKCNYGRDKRLEKVVEMLEYKVHK